MKKGVYIKCDYCGKEIYRQQWQFKGYKLHYCSNKCHNLHQPKTSSGKRTNISGEFKKGHKINLKNGKYIKNGYVHILNKKHPRAVKGYVAEHRLVMEEKIGRYLNRAESVHHINEIKTDNRKENLMLFESESAHQKYHHKKQ